MADDSSQLRVLVVDDEKLMRDAIKVMLQGLEANVVGEADNGKKAIVAFDKHNPDITFLDISMPVKNGVDALREILAKDPSAVVIMLTAHSDISVAESCIHLGARDYISKGVPTDVLMTTLKAQLDSLTAS